MQKLELVKYKADQQSEKRVAEWTDMIMKAIKDEDIIQILRVNKATGGDYIDIKKLKEHFLEKQGRKLVIQ